MITVSVPGKIHLMGEHAVVYGKPALLTAVNKRMRVSVEPYHVSRIKYQEKNNIKIVSAESDEYVRHIISVVQEHFKLEKLPLLTITIDSDFPAGYHLGSSAAVAVGVTAALVYTLKKVWNPELFNKLAYEAEKKQHGNPSGGDNTAVTFGGLLWYRRELEFLKSMWQLPFRPAKNLSHFYLIDTGRPKESTGEMVAMVKSKVKNQKSKMERLMSENEEQTKQITVALKEGDEQVLVDAMRKGEKTLEGMGVVSKKVIPIIRFIEKQGGAAKILGGGGSTEGVGYLLAYTHAPQSDWQPIVLGEEGIRLE